MTWTRLTWRKSSHSQGGGADCVEVAGAVGSCAVRDSKDPNGPVLRFGQEEWATFLNSVKNDGHDLP
ncbi:DUF397 domain-containing protein [Actinomadura sp. 6N118]|uniref:DUF397 domain-containing protein n=1 Tax=Actinomadura sp. 6N118 TaxID=3375151 RepID=UPI003797FCF4